MFLTVTVIDELGMNLNSCAIRRLNIKCKLPFSAVQVASVCLHFRPSVCLVACMAVFGRLFALHSFVYSAVHSVAIVCAGHIFSLV